MIGAERPPRHDNADRLRGGATPAFRPRPVQHGPDLHRRCMRPQQRPALSRTGMNAGIQIKCIHHRPRRMMPGDIQRPECEPVILNIRTLFDRKSHRAENRRNLLHGPADRVNKP
jgi:hypothetical protein